MSRSDIGLLITPETTLVDLERRLQAAGAHLHSVRVFEGHYTVRLTRRGLHFGAGKTLDRALADAVDTMEST